MTKPSAHPFNVRVNGDRLFRITTADAFGDGEEYTVDCRDVRSTFESQAIVPAKFTDTRESLLAHSQVRDAIASSYLNATSHESGQFPGGGTSLPDGYSIEIL